jgi:hypothetical protein
MLDCPRDCVYLQQAREHEKRRQIEDLDRNVLFPQVVIPEPFIYEHEHLIVGLSYAMFKSTQADRSLHDLDLIAAVSALVQRYETLVNSGLHYETPVTSASRQAVAAEVQTMVKEYRDAEQKHLGYTRLRDTDVLQALVFIVRLAYGRTSGRPKSRAFVDFLYVQFPEKQSAITAPEQTGSRIIVP